MCYAIFRRKKQTIMNSIYLASHGVNSAWIQECTVLPLMFSTKKPYCLTNSPFLFQQTLPTISLTVPSLYPCRAHTRSTTHQKPHNYPPSSPSRLPIQRPSQQMHRKQPHTRRQSIIAATPHLSAPQPT